MIDILKSLGWVVLWSATLGGTANFITMLRTGQNFDEKTQLTDATLTAAVPVLWAILIVFWFN